MHYEFAPWFFISVLDPSSVNPPRAPTPGYLRIGHKHRIINILVTPPPYITSEYERNQYLWKCTMKMHYGWYSTKTKAERVALADPKFLKGAGSPCAKYHDIIGHGCTFIPSEIIKTKIIVHAPWICTMILISRKQWFRAMPRRAPTSGAHRTACGRWIIMATALLALHYSP